MMPRQLPCSHTISGAGIDQMRLPGLQPLQHIDINNVSCVLHFHY